MNILAIDDDVGVRKVLAAMLEFWEPEIDTELQTYFAYHGLEGMQWIELHGIPDIILLDVRMPQMNGAEFLQQAHQRKWDLQSRVLLLTGYADDLERHIGSEALNMPHLRKPFTMQELHQSLDILLEQQGR